MPPMPVQLQLLNLINYIAELLALYATHISKMFELAGAGKSDAEAVHSS